MWVKTEGGRTERHSNGRRREKRGARWCQARQALIALVGPGGDHWRPERAHHHRSSPPASKQAVNAAATARRPLATDCCAANARQDNATAEGEEEQQEEVQRLVPAQCVAAMMPSATEWFDRRGLPVPTSSSLSPIHDMIPSLPLLVNLSLTCRARCSQF
jgi:hypothetical protein